MRNSQGRMSAATRIACLILIFACVNPLITDLTPIPDVSGAEGALAVIGWVIGIFATQRVTALDGILAPVSYTHLTLPTIYSV